MLRKLLTRLLGARQADLPPDPFGDPSRDERADSRIPGTAGDAARYQPVTDLPSGGSFGC